MGKVIWNKKKICHLLLSVFLLVMVSIGCASQKDCQELELEFYYRVDYFNIYDLSGSAFPDAESLETMTSQFIREIEDVLGLYYWWENVAPEADTLEISVEIGSSGEACTYGLEDFRKNIKCNCGSGAGGTAVRIWE